MTAATRCHITPAIASTLIGEDDTVTVDGLPGRWVVCDIHQASRSAGSRDTDWATVSRTTGSRRRGIHVQVIRIDDVSRIRFVRPGNEDMDNAGLDYHRSSKVIIGGAIADLNDLLPVR